MAITSCLRLPLATLVIGAALLAPAAAVDTVVSKDAPDLTSPRAKIKAKNFAAARDELMALITNHQHADVYNLLAFSLRKTGDHAQALTFYQKALDFDPDHKSAREYLGELYVETKQPEKAREQLRILMRLCPAGCEEREDLEKAMTDAGIPLTGK